MESEESSSELKETTEEILREKELRDKIKKHPLFETAKAFWRSPWGKEAISKAVHKPEYIHGNKLSEGSEEREENSQEGERAGQVNI